MFLQALVEVPQYLGVSLLVEGAQIRRPLSSRVKTFIRSHYESLHKSRRVLQPHTCPSGKENQREEEEEEKKRNKNKKTWPLVSTRKVAMERSLTLQPLIEKRFPRPALPSSSGPLPNPSVRRHLHTSHTRTHLPAEPTHTLTGPSDTCSPCTDSNLRWRSSACDLGSHTRAFTTSTHTLLSHTHSHAHTSASHCCSGRTQRHTETEHTPATERNKALRAIIKL